MKDLNINTPLKDADLVDNDYIIEILYSESNLKLCKISGVDALHKPDVAYIKEKTREAFNLSQSVKINIYIFYEKSN